MTYPNHFHINHIMERAGMIAAEIDGVWEYARPAGYPSFWSRFKCAWLVFTGKADALTWEKQ